MGIWFYQYAASISDEPAAVSREVGFGPKAVMAQKRQEQTSVALSQKRSELDDSCRFPETFTKQVVR
jgi:hypothetical protein